MQLDFCGQFFLYVRETFYFSLLFPNSLNSMFFSPSCFWCRVVHKGQDSCFPVWDCGFGNQRGSNGVEN